MWDKEGTREVSGVSLETDRYEAMDAVELDGDIFMVTASRDGKLCLYSVGQLGSTLDAKNINSVPFSTTPIGLHIYGEEEDKQSPGQFSVLFAGSNTLYSIKAQTNFNPRGPRPMLMVKGRIHLENWDMEPNFKKFAYELNQQSNPILQDLFSRTTVDIEGLFIKLHKRAFALTEEHDSKKIAFNIVIKDDGRLEIDDHTQHKVHNKAVSGVGIVEKNRIVTCGQDGKIKAWRITDNVWDQVGEFTGHGPAFTAMELVGERLVVGDAAGNVFCLEIK